MKTRRFLPQLAVAMAVTALCGANIADAQTPRSGTVTVTRTGPAGNTSTRHTTVTTNGQGGYTAQSTFTGPAGKTTTRQTVGSYDPATQTYSRSSVTTYPNGQQSSSTKTVTR